LKREARQRISAVEQATMAFIQDDYRCICCGSRFGPTRLTAAAL
jgi:hypothetical protein